MKTLWIPICIVSGILQWSAGHVVYPIEPPRRTRHSIDEWRPLKDEMALGLPRHTVRYPYYYKSPYSLYKKLPIQQSDNSDTVEVFSSAPPSILGSLSVFGHATVNAREPASRISLKSSRPQIIQEQSEHHPYYHQHHHAHHAHEHQKTHLPLYASYEDRTLYDPSLRPPPPREHVAESNINLVPHPHPHSSSLTPNSYFFETPQPFQPPGSDIVNGFHKIRKPVYKPVTHNPYRLTSQLYTSVNPLDQFKTPTHLPTSYEDNLSFDRGINKYSKYNIHLSKPSGLSSYYSRNPFGDIHLSTRRPDVSLKYSNQDQIRNNVKDEYDQYSQARPFQKPPSFTPSPSPPKEYDPKPFVTTFSSISSTDNSPKYSSAQPFFPGYENHDVAPSVKPEYLVTHQPFTDSTYPYAVTTVEVPTETSPAKVIEETPQTNDKNTWDQGAQPNNKNTWDQGAQQNNKNTWDQGAQPNNKNTWDQGAQSSDKDAWDQGAQLNNKNSWDQGTQSNDKNNWDQGTSSNDKHNWDQGTQSNDKNNWDQVVKSHASFEPSDARRPQIKINSFSGYNEREPQFLPTPSTDTGSRVSFTQGQLSLNNNVRPKPSNNVNEYQQEKKPEDTTEYFTTELPEFTTKPIRQFSKNRRRPVNKHNDNFNKFSEFDDNSYKGHRPDNHKRRRKPSYGGRGGDRNRQSEFKKQRTTTTTQEPEVYEPTLYNNEFSTMPITEDVTVNSQIFTTDISIKSDFEPVKNEYEQNSDIMHFTDESPENEVKTLHNHKLNSFAEETPLTTAHPPVPLTVMTISTTTTTTTTERPETSTLSTISNRLKNKYGNNRPRFSVKEYRERLNRGTSTTPPAVEETTEKIKSPVREQQDILKNTVRIRGSSQYNKQSADANNSSVAETNKRKYKPRVGPSRYRISTSTSTSVSTVSTTTPTTERSNTFRPSTIRYKPGTGKYYSRYRTSTVLPKDFDDVTPPPAKIVIKPKGVFSAKRKPFPLKSRYDADKDSDGENLQDDVMQISQGEIELSKYPDSIRNFENEVAPSTVITKKMDNEATTTSSEERDDGGSLSLADPISDPTGLEALRIADLTSSSSNDFHTSGFRHNNNHNHRTLPKIAFPTEEPILPLEAFFQNHANKE